MKNHLALLNINISTLFYSFKNFHRCRIELIQFDGFIAYDPTVMASLDYIGIPLAEFHFSAVIVLGNHATADYHANMLGSAAFSPSGFLNTARPTPSRLQTSTEYFHVT
tara:strand:+ start:900 stop:1226 length:327 start_codon:yes stop_codon:yes gene_type:complete